MRLFSTLYARLTAVFLVLVIALGAALLYLSALMSELYSQEIMQRLNGSVAMYIAGQQQLINQGVVDESAVEELANRAMVIHPSLEIYILDARGRILSHRLPPESVLSSAVDLAPLKAYLAEGSQRPIAGHDPRDPLRPNVFSAWPIEEAEQVVGYVYAIVGGQMYKALRAAVNESYVVRVGLLLMAGSILVAALAGSVVFFFLTRRLSRLRRQVVAFSPGRPEALAAWPEVASNKSGDEVDQLGGAFAAMAGQINRQFEALRMMDETRRELIANVSHDLRTPLAAMQGYIETLLIKNRTLDEEERGQYLETAYRHSQRLSKLVAELFELAKLEAHSVEPKLEPFSLLELVHDSVQAFALMAESRDAKLIIEAEQGDCHVVADIALIHRVLQNLLDNALRHTPEGGCVRVRVSHHAEQAAVEIADNGRGIEPREIPLIFDRFYQSKQHQPSDRIGSGLGLAIVKRILELHHSRIGVRSTLDVGTSFFFELPVAA